MKGLDILNVDLGASHVWLDGKEFTISESVEFIPMDSEHIALKCRMSLPARNSRQRNQPMVSLWMVVIMIVGNPFEPLHPGSNTLLKVSVAVTTTMCLIAATNSSCERQIHARSLCVTFSQKGGNPMPITPWLTGNHRLSNAGDVALVTETDNPLFHVHSDNAGSHTSGFLWSYR
jgi:hypothetical protein